MIVLHVAALTGNKSSGVDVVVPQYLSSQKKTMTVGLLNVLDGSIQGVDSVFSYKSLRTKSISDLADPFNAPDIVVFHGIYYYPFVRLSKELKKKKIPYIVIPHGSLTSFAQSKKRAKKLLANLLFFKRFVSGASSLHFLSQSEARRSDCFGAKYFICPNGVSLPTIPNNNKNRRTIKFLYLGRLEYKIKGIDILLDAIEINRAFLKDNNVLFDLYGPDVDGSLALIKREIIKRNIGDIAFVHNAVFGLQKQNVFMESDVFVQSSRSEGLPTGVLEAMAYSLPCLLTYGTSLGEYVLEHKCGWASNNDSFDLADKMRVAVSEKNFFSEKGLNARRSVEECFSWEHNSRELFERYEEIIGDKSSSE